MKRSGQGITNQQRLLAELLQEHEELTKGASKEKLLAYLDAFSSASGKVVLEDLRASYGGISLVPGYPDVTAFKEGRRSVLDDIHSILDIARAVDPKGGE